MTAEPERAVRSFVRRKGRITASQARALETHRDRFVLRPDPDLDLDRVFARHAPRVLEIGFGMGDALIENAVAHPGRDHIGIEVYDAGIGRTLARASALGLDNLRLFEGDAAVLLPACFSDQSLSAVLLYFPDPWPKKRHHKRRLVQPAFAALVQRKLEPGGRFHLATDWEPYAEHMRDVLETVPGLRNEAGPGRFSPRPAERPLTKFERRGERLGHAVFDLIYACQPRLGDAVGGDAPA